MTTAQWMILAAKLYSLAGISLVLLWGISIYKNAKGRGFAYEQLVANLPSHFEREYSEKTAEILRSRINNIIKAETANSKVESLENLEFDLVNLYLLRTNLNISQRKIAAALASLEKSPNFDYQRIVEGTTRRISGPLSKWNLFDRLLIQGFYKSKLIEIKHLADQTRRSRSRHVPVRD